MMKVSLVSIFFPFSFFIIYTAHFYDLKSEKKIQDYTKKDFFLVSSNFLVHPLEKSVKSENFNYFFLHIVKRCIHYIRNREKSQCRR